MVSACRPQIRILVADDHPIVRQGIGGLIALQPDISNNAGSCQEVYLYFLFSHFFFRAHNSVHSEEWSYWFR
jgi:hypothetical protein